MAGASVSGTTTWAFQILSYRVFIICLCLCGWFLCCVRHPYVIADQLTHFLGRNDSLLCFFSTAPALQIRCPIAAAKDFHNRAFYFGSLARQLKGMIEQHSCRQNG